MRAGMRDATWCTGVFMCGHTCHCLQSTVYSSLAEIWRVCIMLLFASQCQRLYFVLLPFTALYVCRCLCLSELCYGQLWGKTETKNTCSSLLNSFMCGKLNEIIRAEAAGHENSFFHPPATAAEFAKPLQDAFITSKCLFFLTFWERCLFKFADEC